MYAENETKILYIYIFHFLQDTKRLSEVYIFHFYFFFIFLSIKKKRFSEVYELHAKYHQKYQQRSEQTLLETLKVMGFNKNTINYNGLKSEAIWSLLLKCNIRNHMKVQTLSAGVMLVMDSSVRVLFESFLASPPSKVSCFCRSSMYSACNVHSEG